MIRTVRTFVAPLVVAAALAFAAVAPAAAQQSCMSNREVQAALARGEIAPVAQVLANAGVDRNSEVLSVQVCQSDGGWAYHVGVIDASGKARTLVLRAGG